jgi:hypothetical protein
MPEAGTHWVATRLTAIHDSTSLRKTEDSHPTPLFAARTVFETGSILDRFVFREAESSGVEPRTRACHRLSRPRRARLELHSVAEAGGLEPHAACAARIAFQASSVPDGFLFQWSGQGDLNPQPLGSGPSALARLSYTQVLDVSMASGGAADGGVRALGVEPRQDAYKTSRPDRGHARIGGRGDANERALRRWAICESNAVRAPYQRAQGHQPVMARRHGSASRERGRNRKVPTRGFEPPLRGA